MKDLSIIVQPTPGVITANFDDIKVALQEQMTAYAELEVTEDNIPERKKDVATLRKISGAIDDKRKEVKKAYTAPLEEFEAKAKELTGIIGEQINRINSGLDVFEKKRIQQKRDHVKELYLREASEFTEYIPLEKIYNPKWDNKSFSDNEIVSDIQQRVLAIKSDLAAIRGLNSKYEEQLLGAYKIGGLVNAMAKHNDFVEAEKAVEKEKREEESRIAQKAAENNQTVNPSPVEEKPVKSDSGMFSMNDPVWVISISGQENIDQVRELLQFNEIPFEEVRA